MKAVLISIQPRHCANIASGKKTVEVRKTAPKIPPPFKCYIYETKKDDGTLIEFVHDGDELYGGDVYHGKAFPVKGPPFGWFEKMPGKVIGEFVCDEIYEILPHGDGYSPNQYECGWKYDEGNACITFNEMRRYLGANVGYGWHISDLKIYDKPKELGEFRKPCASCGLAYSKYLARYMGCWDNCRKHITRPPQSWMYVEEI